MNNKILVTGGAGYIGSHTVIALIDAGYVPIIVDDFSNSDRSALKGLENILKADVKHYEGDCNDEVFMRRVFENETDLLGVIHFAAYKAVAESVAQPIKYYRNNIGSLLT
ncbi:MAG: UDP-glucose 4-epimerase, partial [Lysobacterales bacterium]